MDLVFPFEGDPHAATWLAWPQGQEEWQGQLEPAREEFAQLVQAIAQVEPVQMLVSDGESQSSIDRWLGSCLNVTFHHQPLDDCWFRDNGPTFVKQAGRVVPICWHFNAWGGKYPHARDATAAASLLQKLGITPGFCALVNEGGSLESDGAGMLLTTSCCQLHPQRNPGLDRAQIEAELAKWLGVHQQIWLDYGLEGDHTDGHIDTLTRFVAPGRVVTSVCSRQDHNFAGLESNRRQLAAAGLEVWELPIPEKIRHFAGVRLPETYANFYLCNGRVIVPQYGDIHDRSACDILQQAFPQRTVVPLSARAIITSGGAFHCLTQQQPEGQLCSWV